MSRYKDLTPEQISDGIDVAIEEAEEVLDSLISLDGERDFENTMRPLDRIADIIAHADNDYYFMGYVHTDKEVRTAAKQGEEEISKWASDIFFRDDLNAAIQDYAATEEAKNLDGEQKRLLEHVLRDLRRAGHELDADTRARVKALTQREIELGVRFQQNIDEWDDWILASREDLEGMPDSWIEGLDVDEETGKYKVTIA